MDRGNRYEAAFEAYLQAHRHAYIAINEQRRTVLGDAPVKNLDFIVCNPRADLRLMIDVKGRQLRNRTKRKGFETWATEADVKDLLQWEQVFGEGFTAVFGFVYWIYPPLLGASAEPGVFEFRERWYLLMGIDLAEYRDHMRRRSAKWETVCLPAEDFRSLARPIESWL